MDKLNTENSWEQIVSSVRALGPVHSQQLLTVSGILERATDGLSFPWEAACTENECHSGLPS